MGITGLLPLLKKASKNCHVRKFSGATVAVDGFVWLHKGAFGCAAQLGKGEPTTAYVTYCLKYINVLISHGVKPIIVFDGRSLPAKAVTDNKRRAKRAENKKRAQQCLREGKNKEAWECFTRCVEITPAMTRELIKVLRQQHIDYIIAPYEADAQLAYLSLKGIVDIIITEDSDLVLFGCSKIFFKMNVNGDGVLFDNSKLPACMGVTPKQFHFENLRRMCILSGCDYLPSIPGIGLGKAKKVFMPASSSDIRQVLVTVPTLLQLNSPVPEEYIEGFIQAENTFLYQLAFDPISRSLVPLTPYPVGMNIKMLDYAGSYVDNSLAQDMALGNVDVKTQERVDNFNPQNPKSGYKDTSIWSKNYKIPQTSNLVLNNDKKETKHSSTAGINISVRFSSALKKRSIDCQNDGEKDEDLLSIYKFEKSTIDEEKSENNAKRIKVEEDDTFDTEETEKASLNIKNWREPGRVLRSSSRNPFLKSPEKNSPEVLSSDSSIKTRLKASQPVVVNKEPEVIVKSQYFKPESPVKSNQEIANTLSPSLMMTRSFYITGRNANSPKAIDLATSPKRSQGEDDGIHSSSDNSLGSPENKPDLDGGRLCHPSLGVYPTVNLQRIVTNTPPILPSRPKVASQNKPTFNPTLSSSCRRVGLSKASNKREPNQRSLRDMFASQPKSKI